MANAKKRQNSWNKNKTQYLVTLGVLVAVVFVLEATNLAFIRIVPGALELTTLMLPVIIAAIALGKGAGAVMGGVFGIASIMEAILGKNALGVYMLGVNPFYLVLITVVSRVLAGFLCGLAFEYLVKFDRRRIWCYAATGFIGSVLNTVLFLSAVFLLFGGDPAVQEGVFNVIGAVITVGAIPEAVFCTFIGYTVATALEKAKLTNN